MSDKTKEILEHIEKITSDEGPLSKDDKLASLSEEERIDVDASTDMFDYKALHAFANRHPYLDINYREEEEIVEVDGSEFEFDIISWQKLQEEYEDVDAVAECVVVMEMYFSDEIEANK